MRPKCYLLNFLLLLAIIAALALFLIEVKHFGAWFMQHWRFPGLS